MLIRCFAAALLAGASLASAPLCAQDYDAPGYSTPAQAAAPEAGDPPARVARLSLLNGDASLEPASVDQFSPAEVNYPLSNGDRLYTGSGSEAELEAGQMAVRLAGNTDFTVTALTDTLAQFGLAAGSVHLRTFALEAGTATELDTPNAAVSVIEPGDVRVDVEPNRGITIVTLLSGVVRVDAEGVSQELAAGQSLRLTGTATTTADWVRRARVDALDQFSTSRDALSLSESQGENDYLDAATVGGGDLEQYGSWSENVDADEGGTIYSTVWFPTVAVGWAPYRNGRWAFIAPWGWTWIGAEPWGFAPFHYGRWTVVRGRWGWLPGPRILRPVYSPALVGFVGSPGTRFTAWFPLGPHEVYRPPYRASSLYLNRVNVSNIGSRNLTDARRIYNERSRDMFAGGGAPPSYRNRSVALTAMERDRFSAGRPVREDHQEIDLHGIATAPVLNRPQATPDRRAIVTGDARVVPTRQDRPNLAMRGHGNPEPQPNSAGSAVAARTAMAQEHSGGDTQPGFYHPHREPATGEAQGLSHGTLTAPLGSGARGTAPESAGTMQAGPRRQPVDPGLRPNGTVERPSRQTMDPAAQPSPAQPVRTPPAQLALPQAPRQQEMNAPTQPPRPTPAPQLPNRPASVPQPARPAAPTAQPQASKR